MKKAKLQLALDDILLSDALRLIEKVRPYVDIIEVGTPLAIREGMHAVRALREAFPEKEILADLKIMDAGEYEAGIAFEAGADYCTVLGCTDLLTIEGCLKAAEKAGRRLFVDMITVEDMDARVRQLEAIGVTHIAAHTGTDRQAAGGTPLEHQAGNGGNVSGGGRGRGHRRRRHLPCGRSGGGREGHLGQTAGGIKRWNSSSF